MGGLRRFLPSDLNESIRLQDNGRPLPLDGDDFIEEALSLLRKKHSGLYVYSVLPNDSWDGFMPIPEWVGCRLSLRSGCGYRVDQVEIQVSDEVGDHDQRWPPVCGVAGELHPAGPPGYPQTGVHRLSGQCAGASGPADGVRPGRPTAGAGLKASPPGTACSPPREKESKSGKR